jgi:hypothetical protein
MTVSKTSFLVHTKIGPELGEEGNSSSLLTITSPSTPISNNACPTRPPPIIIADSTLFDEDAITVAVTFLPLDVLLTARLEDFFDEDDDDAQIAALVVVVVVEDEDW